MRFLFRFCVFAGILAGGGISSVAEARICSAVPDGPFKLVRDHLIRTIQRRNIRGKAVDVQIGIAAKTLGMMMLESGGDPSKITMHGAEHDRTPDYDWRRENHLVSIKQVEAHLKQYLGKSRKSTNFGALQKSPDTVIYNGDVHKRGRTRFDQFQKAARTAQPAALADACLADRIFLENAYQIGLELKKLATCDYRLNVKYGKTNSDTVVYEDRGKRACFARISMLCPQLQLDWITDMPRSVRNKYFGTKDASPRCYTSLLSAVKQALRQGEGGDAGGVRKSHRRR